MAADYGFLRFEIVGLSTVIFLSIGILPLVRIGLIAHSLTNVTAALSVLASLLLLSMPIGYWEHQLIVNHYRSENKNRPALLILRDIVSKNPDSVEAKFLGQLSTKKQNALLTSLIELCIFSEKTEVSENIYERLGDRWSHFYARKGVGILAPVSGLILFLLALAVGLTFVPSIFLLDWQTILVSTAVWLFIFAFDIAVINPYSEKIWEEICFLESEIILSKKEETKKLVENTILGMAEYSPHF
jgi:hypothetical protein